MALPRLQRASWQWHDNGAIVSAVVDGRTHQIWVPVGHIVATFGSSLQSAGIRLPHAVGGYQTVSGFFDSIVHVYKKATRAIKKRLPKAVRKAVARVEKHANKAARVAQNIASKYGEPIGKVLSSKVAQAVVTGIGVAIPVTAPAMAGVLAAQVAVEHVLDGIAAARKIAAGVRATEKLVSAVKKGHIAQGAINIALEAAKQGSPEGAKFAGALATVAAGRVPQLPPRAQAMQSAMRAMAATHAPSGQPLQRQAMRQRRKITCCAC